MRNRPIRVLVVDDSPLVRRMITDILTEDPRTEVAGEAPDGRVALQRMSDLEPDVVLLDVDMPQLDGLGTVRELRARGVEVPVVMFSTLTEQGAAVTTAALICGASDYVTKPSGASSPAQARRSVRDELVPKLVALVQSRRFAGRPPVVAPVPVARRRTGAVQVIAIGSSTGGPDALAKVLGSLPTTFPVPILIVQHMPPLFTRTLAQRLDSLGQLPVRQAADGDDVRPGQVLIAPGDRHLEVSRVGGQVRVRLSQAPAENFCRPSVDVLFRSVAASYGDGVLGVVLTGMGRDGAAGAAVVRRAGGQVFAQDQGTSVIWGMPGAVASAGHADRVLPLAQMGPALLGAATSRPVPEFELTAAGTLGRMR